MHDSRGSWSGAQRKNIVGQGPVLYFGPGLSDSPASMRHLTRRRVPVALGTEHEAHCQICHRRDLEPGLSARCEACPWRVRLAPNQQNLAVRPIHPRRGCGVVVRNSRTPQSAQTDRKDRETESQSARGVPVGASPIGTAPDTTSSEVNASCLAMSRNASTCSRCSPERVANALGE